MRERLTTLAELAGFTLISVGAWQVSVPLGLIVGGSALVLVGWLGGRS